MNELFFFNIVKFIRKKFDLGLKSVSIYRKFNILRKYFRRVIVNMLLVEIFIWFFLRYDLYFYSFFLIIYWYIFENVLKEFNYIII